MFRVARLCRISRPAARPDWAVFPAQSGNPGHVANRKESHYGQCAGRHVLNSMEAFCGQYVEAMLLIASSLSAVTQLDAMLLTAKVST